MFLGHYGLAFAAKRVVPRTSLGALTFAAEFLDELWPILLLLGVEQVKIVPGIMATSPLDFVYYPYSHSLVMAIVWGALIGLAYYELRRYGRGAWIMALLVVSHWVLDLPMHRPDLPLWPGANSPKFGWGRGDIRDRVHPVRSGHLFLPVRDSRARSHRKLGILDLRRCAPCDFRDE